MLQCAVENKIMLIRLYVKILITGRPNNVFLQGNDLFIL